MASLSGRGLAALGIVAARRAIFDRLLPGRVCWAVILLGVPQVEAATFEPIVGELEIRAGSHSPLSTQAVLGSASLSDFDQTAGFHQATASLIASVTGGSMFAFSATASSVTNRTAPVDQFNATATVEFSQSFTTLTPQWLELSARVTSPPEEAGVDATLIVTRMGQGVPAFSVGHTGTTPVTLNGLYPAGTYVVQGTIDTRAATVGAHSGVIDGSILIASLADFNGNGSVDGDDLATWRTGYGSTTGTFASGNLDGDGDTDGADFLLWQRQFGTAALAAPAVASIPEPTGGSLAVGALAAVATYCRTRRSAA